MKNPLKSYRDRWIYHDPRITAKSMTFHNYLMIFLAMLVFCGSYAGLYFLQIEQKSEGIYIVLSMFTFVVVISLVTCLAFARFRLYYMVRPMGKVCEAAQKVAAGDYSIRIAPLRTDGEKDEFEVLIEDFNTMARELGSTEMLKNDFISNVSHELKTPLAVIQNYAAILQSEELTEMEQREYAQKIGEAAGRLTVLITNILQVNRLENQKITAAPSAFNLSEALSRCILNYDALMEEKNIALEAQLDQNLILCSDEDLLDIVWNNLLSNAVKFTPEGGRIRVDMKREGECVRVTVADTGCGISQEDQKHIFDKFYQADASHATAGNGLGLALVRRVLELLGGSITVQSTQGKGSSFTVSLPCGQ